jgi:hypothetical protein
MSNVVEFPPSDRPVTVDDIDALHSEAFRELEGPLMDCVMMAKIATERITDRSTNNREIDEALVFTVCHTFEMLLKLKKDYYASYGEKQAD